MNIDTSKGLTLSSINLETTKINGKKYEVVTLEEYIKNMDLQI